jgi:hypothetical protein
MSQMTRGDMAWCLSVRWLGVTFRNVVSQRFGKSTVPVGYFWGHIVSDMRRMKYSAGC